MRCSPNLRCCFSDQMSTRHWNQLASITVFKFLDFDGSVPQIVSALHAWLKSRRGTTSIDVSLLTQVVKTLQKRRLPSEAEQLVLDLLSSGRYGSHT